MQNISFNMNQIKSMLVWESLKRKQKDSVIIKSILWNSIIWVYKEEKKIDIEKKLISIKIWWKKIKVKTNNPLLNENLNILNEKITKYFLERLKNIWIKLDDIEIKYI